MALSIAFVTLTVSSSCKMENHSDSVPVFVECHCYHCLILGLGFVVVSHKTSLILMLLIIDNIVNSSFTGLWFDGDLTAQRVS